MKRLGKWIVQSLLFVLARWSIAWHRPFTIAVAGSTDKTVVKDAVREEFVTHAHTARANPKSYNTEIGLPLAILALPSGNASLFRWATILLKGFVGTLLYRSFPSVLIVELGVDHPGDMRYLLKIVHPNVAIVTSCTSEYISNFGVLDRIAKEYGVLVAQVPHNGLVVLHSDDERIAALRPTAACTVIAVGESPLADRQLQGIQEAISTQQWRIVHTNDRAQEFGQLTTNRPGAHHRWARSVAMIVHRWYDLNRLDNPNTTNDDPNTANSTN